MATANKGDTNYDGRATEEQAQMLQMVADEEMAKKVRAEMAQRFSAQMMALAAQVSIYHGSLIAQGISPYEAMELSKAFQEQMIRMGGAA